MAFERRKRLTPDQIKIAGSGADTDGIQSALEIEHWKVTSELSTGYVKDLTMEYLTGTNPLTFDSWIGKNLLVYVNGVLMTLGDQYSEQTVSNISLADKVIFNIQLHLDDDVTFISIDPFVGIVGPQGFQGNQGQKGINGSPVPVGAIMTFAQAAIPEHYIECDGRLLDRNTYPQLFSTIGTTYGTTDASNFRVPDLRGLFIRGWSHGSNLYDDPVRTIGSFQDDSFEGHSHPASQTDSAGSHQHAVYGQSGLGAPGGGGIIAVNNVNNAQWSAVTNFAGAHTHNLTVGSFGGSETRPKNLSMVYAIKSVLIDTEFEPFIGPQGVQGAQGTQGVRGYQGYQGTQGVQGPLGNTGADGTPVGSIIYMDRATPPTGYLVADGSFVDKITYNELYAVLGTRYGDGGATFKLPDLRGEFIRGLDLGRGIDAGRTLGSSQLDDFKEHQHQLDLPWQCSSDWGYGTFACGGPGGSYRNTNKAGGLETRPRNVALIPFIKAFGVVNGPLTIGPQGPQGAPGATNVTGSLGDSGWTKLPNNLIMQWGSVPATLNEEETDVLFPTPFINMVTSITCTYGHNESNVIHDSIVAQWRLATKTGFKCRRQDIGSFSGTISTGKIFWFAIGY